MEKKNNLEKQNIEKKTDYIFAIFLIFVGSILLLNTTGLVEWSVWTILWKFWPLIVVFAGLNLIFEGSKWLSIFLAITSLIILVFVFLWSATLLNVQNITGNWNLSVPNWFTQVVEQEADVKSNLSITQDNFSDIEKKVVEIDMGMGTLDISNEGLQDHLFLEAEYYSRFGEPELKTKVKDDTLEIGLKLGSGDKFFSFGNKSPLYSLLLGSDEIPTDLKLKFGAGKSNILLENYSLNSLKIELGAGDSETILNGILLEDLDINVGVGNFVLELGEGTEISNPFNLNIGTGKLILTLPEGMEYKLKGNLGIGEIKTPEGTISGLGKDFTEIKSKDYDEAEVKIDIVAEIGVGELIIK